MKSKLLRLQKKARKITNEMCKIIRSNLITAGCKEERLKVYSAFSPNMIFVGIEPIPFKRQIILSVSNTGVRLHFRYGQKEKKKSKEKYLSKEKVLKKEISIRNFEKTGFIEKIYAFLSGDVRDKDMKIYMETF